MTHQCLGAYKYKATLASIEARTNGEANVRVYCEMGEFNPQRCVKK